MLSQILWHSPHLWPLAIVFVALVVAAIVWLYKPQVRALPRPWHWLLPALRIAALVALVLSILKPVAVRPKTAQEEGAILLLVDHSRSMSITDPGRSPAQLVALADGLGRLPAGVRADTLTTLRADLDRLRSLADEVVRAQSEVDYAKLSGHADDAAQKRVDDAQKQFAELASSIAAKAITAPAAADLPKYLTEAGNIPANPDREAWAREVRARVDRAIAALVQSQAAADDELYKSNADVRKVCDEISTLSRFALVEQALTRPTNGVIARMPEKAPLYGFGVAEDVSPVALKGDGQPVRRLLIEPIGRGTDLPMTLRASMDRLKGQPVQAVVLFSDGRQVGGDATISSALSATGVPIFTVPAAPPSQPRDLSIVDVSMPISQFVGEMMTVRAKVHGTGMKGTPVDVDLTIGDQKQTQKVTFGDDPFAAVTFEVKLDKPGAQNVEIKVAPVASETTLENNRVERWVKVLSDKIRVLAIAGAPSWDYQYLRNALQRTPWVELQDFILASDAFKLALTPDQIRERDLVILSDVAIGSLSDEQWDAIHQIVTTRGGSVILLAGHSHLPGEYAQHVLLTNFIPWRGGQKPSWRTWPGEEPSFRIIPAPGSDTVDALKLSDDPALAKMRWQQLSPFFRFLPMPELKPNAKALLVERDSQSPVLTESRLGLGRVFFLGADETWRWRYKVGERDQDRFWLQMVRYAAEAPYAAKQGGYAMDVERVLIEPNEPVRVRARLLDEKGVPSSVESLQLRVVKDGKNVQTQTLSVIGQAGSGRYDAIVSDLPEGDYTLKLDTRDDDTTVELPLHVAASVEDEMVDLSGDEKFLRRLAESSGGEVVPMDQLAHLPEKLKGRRSDQAQLAEATLWDSPYLFGFVLACLGAEWALRKRLGLA